MRWPVLCAIFAVFAVGHAPAFAETSGKAWSFSVSAYTYFVPDDSNFLVPVITGDRGRLHLEARYNYEDRDTGSAWIGYNLRFGKA